MLLHSLCWCWEGYREIGRVVAIGIMSDFVFRQPVVAVLTSLFINTLGASWNVVSCSALLKHWGQQGAGGQHFADLPSTLEPPHRTCTRMPFAFMLYTQIWKIPCQMNVILDYSKHIQLLKRECILSWCTGIRSKITEQVAGTVLTFIPAAEVS